MRKRCCSVKPAGPGLGMAHLAERERELVQGDVTTIHSSPASTQDWRQHARSLAARAYPVI